MRKGIFRCANNLQQGVNAGDQPLNALFELAARTAGVQSDEAFALIPVGITRHNGHFLLFDQHLLQCFIIDT